MKRIWNTMKKKINEIPLPQSLVAEAALIGSMILDPTKIAHILEIVNANDISDHDMRVWFTAIESVWRNTPAADISKIDAVAIRNWLDSSGLKLDTQDEVGQLIKIIESVPSAENYEYYAGIVKSKSLERDLYREVERISEIIYNSGLTLEDKQSAFEQAALQLQTKPSYTRPIKDILLECNALWEKGIDYGLPTGFKALDDMLGGLHKGEMIVVAGRPSMGKSSFAIDIALNATRANHRVIIYSLEMSEQQILERMICNIAECDIYTLKQYYSGRYLQQILSAQNELYNRQLWIDASAASTSNQIAAKAMRAKAQYDIDLIIIDYLQLITSTKKSDSRQHEVSQISSEIKALAKRVNVPIILCAQLNRACEIRSDHEPQLSDLRESGSIEQDADVVIFLHRPPYYDIRDGLTDVDSGEAYALVRKNRQGKTGKVPLVWFANWFSFRNVIGDKQVIEDYKDANATAET